MNQSLATTAARALTIVVIAATFVVIGFDRTQTFGHALRPLTTNLYLIAVLLAAVALLLGAVNVAWVHLRRIVAGEVGWINSVGLLLALFVVLAAGLVDSAGAANPLVEWLFDAIIAPGQATLFSLMIFFMAAAAYRYLRIGRPGGAWMLAGALLMMITQLPAANALLPTGVVNFTIWLLDTPGMAAMRGVLLGGSLALVLVGLRMIVGRG